MKVTKVYIQNLDALYNAINGIGPNLIINSGGQGCFTKDQLIVTSEGNKKISEITIGDKVLSFNEQLKVNELKEVTNIFKYENKEKVFKINLKNGSCIEVTENHKFYYNGEWVKIKDLLNIKYN